MLLVVHRNVFLLDNNSVAMPPMELDSSHLARATLLDVC